MLVHRSVYPWKITLHGTNISSGERKKNIDSTCLETVMLVPRRVTFFEAKQWRWMDDGFSFSIG